MADRPPPRLRTVDRQQLLPPMPLEQLLDGDHQARLVWDFCAGCMRTFKILQEKVRRFNADPEITGLLKEVRAGDPELEGLMSGYSKASADAISAVRGAVQALGSGAVPVPTTWISNGVFPPIEVSVAPSLFSKALLAAAPRITVGATA